MVFIAYRAGMVDGFDYYAGGSKVNIRELVYSEERPRRTDISAREMTQVLQRRYPDFMPCAYLNGTAAPDSFKWLLSMRVGTKDRTYGWVGPKFMELSQASYHLVTGRYMSYAAPRSHTMGRSLLATGWPLDKGLRSAAVSWGKTIVRQPLEALKRLHLQSVLMIQPIDILEDGSQNMCDGCPDMTIHEGKLAWSCRLEEPRKFGGFVTTVPKDRTAPKTSLPVL